MQIRVFATLRMVVGGAGLVCWAPGTGRQQQRQPGVQHVGHRRVHPLHGRAAAGRPVAGAVRKLAAHRARIAEGGKGVADLGPLQAPVVIDAGAPVGGPAEALHQLAGQAEGQVEATGPAGPVLQPGAEGVEAREALHALQQQHGAAPMAQRQGDGFAARGPAGEIDADQQACAWGGFAQGSFSPAPA